MVQITASGNSVQFTFQNCPTYLNNGKIEVPKSSLALVIDESNMATFKKAASNDIFVSVSLAELDMTKDELIAYYINNMVSAGGGGGSGVTPEEVTQMINTAIAPIEQDIDFLQDDVDDVSGSVETLSGQVTANTSNISTISGQVQTVSGQVQNKQDTLVSGTNIKTINNQSLLGSGNIVIQGMTPAQEETIATALNELYDGLDDVADDVTTVSGNVSTLTTTVTGIQADLGGIKLVKLTRAQYEALVTKDSNTLYIIPDE